jgi:hypothetical protein
MLNNTSQPRWHFRGASPRQGHTDAEVNDSNMDISYFMDRWRADDFTKGDFFIISQKPRGYFFQVSVDIMVRVFQFQ